MPAPWRSMLYVPANVPRFLAKAAGAGADAILLDLEDSIPPDRKAEARAALPEAVPQVRAGGADVLVRVNRPLGQAVRDIEATIAAGADGIVLTKVTGPEHVRLVAEMLAAAPRPMVIFPLVENAAALPFMEAIARASPLVAGLAVGAEDLAAEIGAEADDETIQLAKRQAIIAAVAAGVPAYGTLGSIADFRDAARLRDLIARSRRAGFAGASCIHPSVVPLLNEGFAPSAADLDLARRQVAAAEAATAEGRGSFVVDGRMVDEPILIRARRILAQARE